MTSEYVTISRRGGRSAAPGSHKAWLIDCDGTLYDARWVRLAMAAELLVSSWPSIPVLRAFRQEHELLRREQADHADLYRLQLQRTARRVHRSIQSVETVVSRWMLHRPGKWLRLFRRRGLLAEIRAYRSRGGRTALVSDYPADAKLQAMHAADLFDVVVTTARPDGPRRLKPDPAGLLLAARRLSVNPGDCLVLGDRDDADGEAARRAGMAYLKIDRRTACQVVRSLRDRKRVTE